MYMQQRQRAASFKMHISTMETAVFWMALQVYWLLSAIAQDQPKNKAVGELRDNCERAALEGSWVQQL